MNGADDEAIANATNLTVAAEERFMFRKTRSFINKLMSHMGADGDAPEETFNEDATTNTYPKSSTLAGDDGDEADDDEEGDEEADEEAEEEEEEEEEEERRFWFAVRKLREG